MKNGVKIVTILLIFCLTFCQVGCSKDKKTETTAVTDTERPTSLETSSAPSIPKITEKEMGEYTYPIFCDEGSPVYIHLPVVLEEYIEETEDGGSRYLINKMIEDYGWQKKDYDGDGQFVLPMNDSMSVSYDSLTKDGDYFYYDCGDMWIRLLILNRNENIKTLVLVPDWIDYSFILPDSPGEYYFNHVIYTPYPYNSSMARIHKNDETRYSTDYEDLVISYDYFVILAFVITWPSIDPYENPFYYLPFDSCGPIDVVEKEILRDEYVIR